MYVFQVLVLDMITADVSQTVTMSFPLLLVFRVFVVQVTFVDLCDDCTDSLGSEIEGSLYPGIADISLYMDSFKSHIAFHIIMSVNEYLSVPKL